MTTDSISPRPATGPKAPIGDPHLGPLLLAIATFLLVYGVEIFSFGISIDEEAATFDLDKGWAWLQQGRWGMALVTLALPDFEAIPLLSTLIFGSGVVFATWRAFSDFKLDRAGKYLFAAVHVGFPVWLHIAQFNTLAAGFGIGIAAAAVGAGAVASGQRTGVVVGAMLIGFSTSVYQTLCLYALLYVVCCIHASCLAAPSRSTSGNESTPTRFLLAAAGWVAGLLFYWSIQKASLAVFGKDMAYVGEFVHLDRLRDNPVGVAASALDYLRSLFAASHPAYLSWGAGVLFLSWLGLLPLWLLAPKEARRLHVFNWFWTLTVTALGLAIVVGPLLLSAATLPFRAQVAVPLLAAWAASRAGPLANRAPLFAPIAITYYLIVVGSIGASMFYVDQVVRNADIALVQRLVPEIEKAAGTAFGSNKIPVTLVGTKPFPLAGQLKRAEVFGTSFFEQDGGNIYRVEFFMRLQGHDHIHPVWLSQRRELIPSAHSMPSWPSVGSVQLVRGTVIVKLGTPTPQQLN